MNKKKNILIIMVLIILTMMFFTYEVVITYDTSHYLWLTSLLTDEGDFCDWDVARGLVFPLYIRICNMLFGQSTIGVLVGMFIFYIAMLVFCYLIYKDTIKNEECFSKKMKYILGFLFFILVVINPILIGFYHTLLTEFFGVTLGVIGCYLAWKWLDIDFKENKLKYIVYTILFSLLIVIAWHLKQPYVTTILYPLVIATVLSLIRNINWKNILQRLVTVLFSIIILVLSLNIWNMLLEYKNVELKEDRTSGGFFASGLVRGITGGYIYTEVEEVSSTSEALKIAMEELFTNPIGVFSSYLRNYLATISIYQLDQEQNVIIENIDLTGATPEIGAIGFRIYNYGIENTFPLSNDLNVYATPYREVNKPIVAINYIMTKLKTPVVIAMKISFLCLPILLIGSIVFVFRTKKRYQEKYNKLIDFITISFGFSFLHIMTHAALAATIDRYTLPAIAPTFIGIILLIYAIVYRKNYKIK